MSQMVENLAANLSAIKLEERKGAYSEFKLAPSQYGMFISLNCKLYLRRSSQQQAHSNRSVEKSDKTSGVSERMQLRGSDWEARICENLRSICLSNPTSCFTDCTNKDFVTFLRGILSADDSNLVYYMYQATVVVTEKDVPTDLKRVDAAVSRIIPDLLKLSRISAAEPWTLTVIDAKSSLTLKQSHQAQVGNIFFTLCKSQINNLIVFFLLLFYRSPSTPTSCRWSLQTRLTGVDY